MKKTNNKGFSLVELIIVIAIMAILIGVLAPQYIKYVERSRVSADKDMVDSLTKAVQTAVTDDDYYSGITGGTDSVTITNSSVTVTSGLTAPINEFYGSIGNNRFKSKAFGTKTIKINVYTDASTSTLKVSVMDGTNIYDPTSIK